MELDDVALERECRRVFQNADEGSKGFLTPTDYKVGVLELLGYKPSKYEVGTIWNTHVEHKKGGVADMNGLDKASFVSLMVDRLRHRDEDEHIRQIFVSFDVRMRGFITEDDCRQAFRLVAPHIKETVVCGLFFEVDSDGDGRVTFRDFELMMKSLQLVPKMSD